MLSVRVRTLAVVCARNELQVRQINYEMNCKNLLDAWVSRLSLLNISTVISCLTVTSRPLNFVRRKWAVLDEWLFVCNYSVASGGWTTTIDIRKAEKNPTLRLTVGIWPWICLVMPGSHITTWHFVYVKRKTTNDDKWVFASTPQLFAQDGREG